MAIKLNIQLQANVMTASGDVEPATAPGDSVFFSLYKGLPGGYEWIADFRDYDLAEITGRSLSGARDYNFIDTTRTTH